MATFLHTMVRITDPERSREFYEALGFRFSRDMDIVREGDREATNYFFSIGDQDDVLELTFNHDGRMYELGTAYGHIAIGVDDLDETLERLAGQGIEPEKPPYTDARAARGSASSATRMESLQVQTDPKEVLPVPPSAR
jgi:lactoylglutathione lyase